MIHCSVTPASYVSGQHVDPRLLTFEIAGLTSRCPVGLLEIPSLGIEPCDSSTTAITAHLVIPSANSLALTTVPSRVHNNRPFEIQLAAVGRGAGVCAAESVASWISAHALLQISVEVPGQSRGDISVPVVARPSGGGWIARALVHPGAWAGAVSVTVHSVSLAERPIACNCLPMTLRVGYNHAQAPAGAVYAAAEAGDLPALQAALDAGGSTEEMDAVR